MPYITEKQRYEIDEEGGIPNTPGELNYIFTDAIVDYLSVNEYNYQTMNDVLGALEGAKLEFYRRVVIPYEQKKMEENGDVY